MTITVTRNPKGDTRNAFAYQMTSEHAQGTFTTAFRIEKNLVTSGAVDVHSMLKAAHTRAAEPEESDGNLFKEDSCVLVGTLRM